MFGSSSFNPDRDIPSLDGKVILITGGNIGLGKQTALELAKHSPAEIWIAARNATTGDAAVAEIQAASPSVSVKFLKLDLASFESVKAAARQFLASATRLDLLLLNAGILGAPAGLTKEGYEIQFGTNHMGHALLLKLLTPILQKTASGRLPRDVRVISVSSYAYRYGPAGGIQFESLKKPDAVSSSDSYGQSKLANILYAREFAKRHPEFTTVSVHPGTVKTELFSKHDGAFLFKFLEWVIVPLTAASVEDGVKNHLWTCTQEEIVNGEYYEPVGVTGNGNAMQEDPELMKRLWEFTENELKGQEI